MRILNPGQGLQRRRMRVVAVPAVSETGGDSEILTASVFRL